LIFAESSVPSDAFPKLEFEFADKFVHLTVYFALFLSAFYSFNNQKKFNFIRENVLASSLFFSVLYGALDEIHQLFVPGRSCDIYDWLADVAGVILAIIVLLIIKKFVNNKKNKSYYIAHDTNK
jgi:VanZ family protein